MSERYIVHVWKVTEYQVTLDVESDGMLVRDAVKMATGGHTTNEAGVTGVIDMGTFPVIREIKKVEQ